MSEKSTAKKKATTMEGQLSSEEVKMIDAYWRAANYL